MRLNIDIDTDQITDRDRRVLAALIADDTGPLVLPRFDSPGHGVEPTSAPAPPLPVPAPADFASKLGDAVAQFSPRGSVSEARLPFAQQAGVRTSSTMPDDDAGEFEDAVMDAVSAPTPPDSPIAHPHAPDMLTQPVDHPQVTRARSGVTVPRDLVEADVEPRRIEDVTRAAILGVVEQPPVRHTSP